MSGRSKRFSFLLKPVAAVALIAALDGALQDWTFGSWLGGWALAWLLLLVVIRPAIRHGAAAVASAAAAGFAVALAWDPGLLGWVLFWGALSLAALLPRAKGFDDAWRWVLRLAVHAASGPFAPLLDGLRLLGLHRQGRGRRGAARILPFVLPVVGSAVFLALFAAANPLIAQAVDDVTLPSPGELALWIAALLLLWPALRPRAVSTRLVARVAPGAIALPQVGAGSVLASLIAFNALFAVQNGLDLAFLWSGAALPDGVTLAQYAHRGAYPLIATALLAGLFVLVALRSGSATAASPAVRRLVVLWVAQNVLLVASSILRTCDYIAVYMLTAWRIAALAWMALVALGLVLICWRMLRGRSAAWLINANALAATAVLAATSVVDLDATAATWNVRHAREVGGAGVALDLCQLRRSDAAALVALSQIERRPLTPGFRDQVRAVRRDILLGTPRDGAGLIARQADWRSWTWRGAGRLADATALLGHRPLGPMNLPAGWTRDCDGTPLGSNQPAEPDAPLTKEAQP